MEMLASFERLSNIFLKVLDGHGALLGEWAIFLFVILQLLLETEEFPFQRLD